MKTQSRRFAMVLVTVVAALLAAACSAPPSAPPRETPVATPAPAVPITNAPAIADAAGTSTARTTTVKLAPRDPTMEAWKRSAAERIHQANQKSLFEGRPHHLLQAVIVVEATVDKNGNVIASRVTRSPQIKRLNDMALASLKAASPLPPPPPVLLVRGNLVFSETWLVQNDNTFRVRTLAMPQE